jgi:hypothetical protein
MGSAAFTVPLSTPMPLPSPSVFTSPLPAPPASAPTLGLTVWTEPVGVAPGETVTFTLRLEDPGGALRTGLWIRGTLPDPLHVVPGQPDWVYDAQAKQLHAELRTLEAGAGLARTLVLGAPGPVDAYAPVALEAVSDDLRATATAEIWIVRAGQARVALESGGLLVSPDRPPGCASRPERSRSPSKWPGKRRRNSPLSSPYSLGRDFAVRGIAFSALGVWISQKELPADPVSWQLVALFRYEEAAAVVLSTQSDIGNYAQPWQPTVRDFQNDRHRAESISYRSGLQRAGPAAAPELRERPRHRLRLPPAERAAGATDGLRRPSGPALRL